MKEGDFVQIDFVGRVAGTDEIFDLTVKDVAEQHKIVNPGQKYQPALVIVGARMVIPALDRNLQEMQVGEEREFDVRPEEGFGERKPSFIKVFSLSKFREAKVEPAPGRFIDIDGMPAKIQSVSGGRVRVDFNHPLAGR